MTTSKPSNTFLTKIFKSSGMALFTVFIWELVEEGLENLIAFFLTSACAIFLAKVLSTIAIVISTQGIKTLIKSCLFPFFKKIIYKEGNDKLEKFKKFLGVIGKGFKWIFTNKKSLTGVMGIVVASLSGTGIIDVSTLPVISIKGINFTPFIYYGVLAVATLIGVTGKGFEDPKTYDARKETEKAEKEAKKLVKEAQKQIDTEQKVAKQNEAKEQAKKAKEQAVAEHNKKVEEVKAKLIADAKK